MSQAQSRPIRAPIRWRCVFVLSALILLLHPRSPALAQVPNQPETDAGPLAANDIVPLAVDDRQKTRRPVVLDVRFVGNHHTKDVQIFNKVKTRPKMEFDSEQLEKDVHGLNSTGRFSNVIPHTKYTRDGVIVTFELIERPVIGYIEHLGNRGMSEKKLTKEHGLKVGDALSPFNVKEGRRKMEELYHQNGFPKATVLVQEGESPKDKGVVYVINEGPIQRVAHVYFTGNRLATTGRLSTFIQSKPGSFSYASPFFSNRFERQKLEQDLEVLRKYYRSLGYFKAEISREVTTDDSGKWVDINFIIDEGPRYNIRNIEITGSNKFDAQKLTEYLKLKKGDPYSQDFMDRDRVLLTDLYGTQGHAFADIRADVKLMEEPGQLDVVYSIAEGAVYHVGEINVHIKGGDVIPHTKETVVLNRANIRHGDLVDAREIRNWERRLKASTLFEVNPQQGDPPYIKINQPLLDIPGLANTPSASTVRGQSPESPAERAQRLDQEEREHESRFGRSMYSWDGPRQSTVREATQVQEASMRVPASQPRTSYYQKPR